MKADILLFSFPDSIKSGVIDFQPKELEKFLDHTGKKGSTVCLIDLEWENSFSGSSMYFNDIKTKHPKKPLSYYFKKDTEKYNVLNGEVYKDYSQLKRSIHDFLSKANEQGLENIFFLLVGKEYIDKATRDVKQEKKIHQIRNEKYDNPFLNTIKHIEYPDNLSVRYIGKSEKCEMVRVRIGIAAKTDEPVLILGESGTGKEVVARNIYECSKRAKGPFVALNCGAISGELVESELFGHEKGSFTGAYKKKIGAWELANNGTLFLDEIGDLPLNQQVKILRAVQQGVIRPVGAETEKKVNVRIIAATNKKLDEIVKGDSGEFREDLYYRIGSIIIKTPALREHPEDIPELVDFINQKKENKIELSSGVLHLLQQRQWKGNIRELKKYFNNLYNYFGSETITEKHIKALEFQEIEDMYTNNCIYNLNISNIDFEKTIKKVEYLLKAALFTENIELRNSLLRDTKQSIDILLQS